MRSGFGGYGVGTRHTRRDHHRPSVQRMPARIRAAVPRPSGAKSRPTRCTATSPSTACSGFRAHPVQPVESILVDQRRRRHVCALLWCPHNGSESFQQRWALPGCEEIHPAADHQGIGPPAQWHTRRGGVNGASAPRRPVSWCRRDQQRCSRTGLQPGCGLRFPGIRRRSDSDRARFQRRSGWCCWQAHLAGGGPRPRCRLVLDSRNQYGLIEVTGHEAAHGATLTVRTPSGSSKRRVQDVPGQCHVAAPAAGSYSAV